MPLQRWRYILLLLHLVKRLEPKIIHSFVGFGKTVTVPTQQRHSERPAPPSRSDALWKHFEVHVLLATEAAKAALLYAETKHPCGCVCVCSEWLVCCVVLCCVCVTVPPLQLLLMASSVCMLQEAVPAGVANPLSQGCPSLPYTSQCCALA